MTTIDAFQEYREKTAPLGSSLYYSLLFSTEEKKQALLALYAYQAQLKQMTEHFLEKEITQAKLQWWQQEWLRMFEGKAQHPISKALQATALEKKLPATLFQEWVDAALLKLDSDHFCTDADLTFFCYREAGICSILAATVLGYAHTESLIGIKLLAESLALVNILTQFSLNIRQGRCFLPLDWLMQQQLSAQELQDLVLDDKLQALLNKTANLASKKYLEGLAHIHSKDKKSLLPILIQAQIAHKQCQKIVKNNFSILKEQVDLTPFSKLMIALKTYIQSR